MVDWDWRTARQIKATCEKSMQSEP
jgi:hypothetical protein